MKSYPIKFEPGKVFPDGNYTGTYKGEPATIHFSNAVPDSVQLHDQPPIIGADIERLQIVVNVPVEKYDPFAMGRL